MVIECRNNESVIILSESVTILTDWLQLMIISSNDDGYMSEWWVITQMNQQSF